jgi:short-subunit dehydrogenase
MKDKVALITGASSGIGLAVAKEWIRRGGRVALVARTQVTLIKLARELGSDVARAYPLDVRDLTALERLPERVAADFGRLDVVINNAGLNHRGSIELHTPSQLADMVTTNLTAPIVLTRAAMPHLQRGGSVVQVASIAGMVPVPGEATYSATKAGLRAFSRAVAEDFTSKDIHVGCVSPGPVDTGFLGDYSDVPDIVLSQPMSTADEVADAVLECIEQRVEEIAVPRRSGQLANLAYLMPSIANRFIRPIMTKRGARRRKTLGSK